MTDEAPPYTTDRILRELRAVRTELYRVYEIIGGGANTPGDAERILSSLRAAQERDRAHRIASKETS